MELAKRTNLRVVNAFFRKAENQKWTWRGLNWEIKNKLDFLLCEQSGIVQDVEVIGKVICSDRRMIRARINLV